MTQAAPPWRALRQQLLAFVKRRVSNEADAEDITQEVLLRAQNRAHQLRDTERLTAWLYRITRRSLVDHYRRQGKAPPPSHEPEDTLPAHPGQAHEEVAYCMRPFLQMLDAPYRQALTLTELDGLTQREAADLVGVPLSTMKSRVQRGRQQMKRHLEDCCHITLDRRKHMVDYQPRDHSCRATCP